MIILLDLPIWPLTPQWLVFNSEDMNEKLLPTRHIKRPVIVVVCQSSPSGTTMFPIVVNGHFCMLSALNVTITYNTLQFIMNVEVRYHFQMVNVQTLQKKLVESFDTHFQNAPQCLNSPKLVESLIPSFKCSSLLELSKTSQKFDTQFQLLDIWSLQN